MRFVATTNVCLISAIHGRLVKIKIGIIKKIYSEMGITV